MKSVSAKFLPYDLFFSERRNRIMAFLNVTEDHQIDPGNAVLTDNTDQKEGGEEQPQGKESAEPEQGQTSPENTGEPKKEEQEEPKKEELSEEEKGRRAADDAEKKALERGLQTLETLFPQAGWDRLPEYPDLYPYFVNIYGMRRGYELISPADPLQQIAPLMHILDDLCVGLRYVTFGTVMSSDGRFVNVNDLIGSTLTNWRRYIDDSFTKEYLPRLSEYCRLLEHSSESRTTSFAKRTLNELLWTKRLYFLPYYKFESLGPPPFQKQDVIPVYSEIRNLRKYLTVVASGIEQGNKRGGAEAKATCEGIENPWTQSGFKTNGFFACPFKTK
jgi:hypothetical protein